MHLSKCSDSSCLADLRIIIFFYTFLCQNMAKICREMLLSKVTSEQQVNYFVLISKLDVSASFWCVDIQ